MKPMTEAHLAILRRHMVEVVEMHFDLAEDDIGRSELDPALRRALLQVPRHLFVPAQLIVAAYQDTPLPIGFDKTLSQPFIGALMIDMLGISPGQKVLEVGTGLGYQAALMAELGADVLSVEIVEEFAEAARLRLAAIDYDVEIRVGDGSRGWSDYAPFDRILVTAAAKEVPAALIEQLAPGGRMIIPLGGEDVQQLSQVRKNQNEELETLPILPVRIHSSRNGLMAQSSAGILMWRRRQVSLELLLGHFGGPMWRNKDAGAWAIPKGLIEAGESAEQAARREFEEELGHKPQGTLTPLGKIRQSGGKWIEAFAMEGDLDPEQIVSNRFTIEWPPRSGRFQSYPELDRVAWSTLPAAREKILASQLPLIDLFEQLTD